MTTLREAAQQALEAIYGAKLCEFNSMSSRSEMIRLMNAAITILEAALAEPACCCGEPNAAGVVHRRDGPCYMAEPVQEPIGEVEQLDIDDDGQPSAWVRLNDYCVELGDKLYTAQPQRKPLTEEEIVDIWADVSIDYDDQINIIEMARAIEKAHGIGADDAKV